MIEFMTKNPIYIVLATSLIVWMGVAIVLQRISGRLSELERRIER